MMLMGDWKDGQTDWDWEGHATIAVIRALACDVSFHVLLQMMWKMTGIICDAWANCPGGIRGSVLSESFTTCQSMAQAGWTHCTN
jgi:hypothetical protein